jgi:hypothetical protein
MLRTPQIHSGHVGSNHGQAFYFVVGLLGFSRLFCILLFTFPNTTARVGQTGFWSGGELREPRQCSIAFPEPCFQKGIRTNGVRALAAACSFAAYRCYAP